MIRLLIADDEALERETLADIVARRFEHEVTIETAENGRKAADTAVLWGADLILMDIEMPGMNGLDAARAVLEQRPECKVIFVTAYSLFQYAHEAMHLGACDYLLKPVNPDEVEASIRKAIRQIEARNKRQLTAKTAESLRQLTGITRSWLRDIMIQAAGASDQVVNADVRPSIEEAAARTDAARAAAAIAAVRRCDVAISYNVSPETCIDAMLLEVRDILYGRALPNAAPRAYAR